MPRPKRPGAGEPKRRSRTGCWPCKARKVKCGEERPGCANCERTGETCDYSIRLNWGGRTRRNTDTPTSIASSTGSSPYESTLTFEENVAPLFPPGPPALRNDLVHHARSHSAPSNPTSDPSQVGPNQPVASQAVPHSMAAASYGEFQTSLPAVSAHPFQTIPATFDYPSPPVSNFEAYSYTTNTAFPSIPAEVPIFHANMPPPNRTHFDYDNGSQGHISDFAQSISGQSNTSQAGESPAYTSAEDYYSNRSASEVFSPNAGPPTPYSPYMPMPLTPNSSVGSEDAYHRAASKQNHGQFQPPPPELRRMSVLSLLAGPPGDSPIAYSPSAHYNNRDVGTITYGYDLGLPDLDTPNNKDYNAIQIFTPPSHAMELDDDTNMDGEDDQQGKEMAFEEGAYYAKPVPIKLSKSLQPLSPILLDNPINLMYFHHFINHTARILVPHDCGQNPFRLILPKMAMEDTKIMSLLLAYSASHRARLLKHPEPVNRIAEWVKDVFPQLRAALVNNHEVPNATLAPAIMMASLQIISPDAFGVSIAWQDHLAIARQMIVSRGGPGSISRDDQVGYFLSRWFAYLEVVGSLSGNKNGQALGSIYWTCTEALADEENQIDCLMGFTARCVRILARIAELAKQCEPARFDQNGNVRPDWRPEPEVVQEAISIRRALEDGLSNHAVYKGCSHRSSSSEENEGTSDASEINATNEMFHWAGLIHLYRRVLGKSAEDAEVQHAVRAIIGLLHKVRRGSTAEACLLFPMVAAGCDANDEVQREKIMERLRCVEGFGMTQFHGARSILEKVWETGRPWESLVSGEFFG
ncbi:hypothetical protein BU24DRAFT_242038 [Aaosphaeria arxii CBS 175.79]|uniref:Zn(2)-C6 fungal-type domain-containing protein n=1 Tax=Aaosphaeria arxii CBS 175.79 TaxID=1450172 RepID=A0A6A5XLB4_9PLEO|nr:uncharacterized protein BU24DRAFT_242038 [Aaosphaeria arxii CBS 175.79]KAF2013639.1 hypothetical protein BU24DRAFT_242038 [Aaosphaeria arxii CBS 175.79]